MVNAILAKRVNHIVTKGDNPAWPKGSKSRGFSTVPDYEALNNAVTAVLDKGSEIIRLAKEERRKYENG